MSYVRAITPYDAGMLATSRSLTETAQGMVLLADALERFKRNQFGATVIPAKDRERFLRLLLNFALVADDAAIDADARSLKRE